MPSANFLSSEVTSGETGCTLCLPKLCELAQAIVDDILLPFVLAEGYFAVFWAFVRFFRRNSALPSRRRVPRDDPSSQIQTHANLHESPPLSFVAASSFNQYKEKNL